MKRAARLGVVAQIALVCLGGNASGSSRQLRVALVVDVVLPDPHDFRNIKEPRKVRHVSESHFPAETRPGRAAYRLCAPAASFVAATLARDRSLGHARGFLSRRWDCGDVYLEEQ